MKALGAALLGMYAHCGPSKCRDPQVQPLSLSFASLVLESRDEQV